MTDFAIKFEDISKRYQLGVRKTHREFVSGALLAVGAKKRIETPDQKFVWALKDISFEVKHGEAIGFVGQNGAGKSTLLKVLSRITRPTSGRAEVRGRMGSLLEVGAGFHQELTGVENIYLNGSVLGMSRREIKNKFDEILEFCELSSIIATPVKHYSSGQYMRLGFAVAAHLDSEILIVDEVLAVGDGAFKEKCLTKMHGLLKDGRTVIFVSHQLSQVRELCTKAIWLNAGKLIEYGDCEDVVSRYEASLGLSKKEEPLTSTCTCSTR